MKETLQKLLGYVIDWAITDGVKLVIALIILFVSFKIVNVIAKRILQSGEKGKFDKTLARTFSYVLKVGLKCVIGLALVAYVGIDTSGLAALVTSLGVCAGLALNGALSNLAGGVLIILTRPFRVDDYIEAQGHAGTVEDIHITYTRIRTPDNKVIYLPNGALSSGDVVNYSEKTTRRVALTFSISYDADYEKAKEIIKKICTDHELVLQDPAPFVRMTAHGDSGIDITARVWVNSGDYWTVNYDLLEMVKAALDEAGIEIPYNQLDVHIKKDDDN